MRTAWFMSIAWGVVGAASWPATGGADDADVLAAQQRRVEVVQRVSPSVVAIFAPGGQGGGSGVLISPDGYALSNFHVTSGTGNFMKCGLNDGKLYDAVIVGIDPTGDVAVLKLLGRDDFPHATIGDSDLLKAGDWVYAMGNPFLLAVDFQPTVTYGIVSGVHRYQYPAGTILEYTDCIQTDSSINPGNSGGPLFNDAGELVGINGRGSFEKRGRVNSGAGYAISINQIMHFLDHLKSGRIVDHATLGAAVTSELDGSVTIQQILEESEAYRRGLRQGDEIVSFAGRPIGSVNQYKNILGIYPKGWKLPIEYRRGQEKATVYVRLRGLHNPGEFIPGQRRDDDPKKPDERRPGPRRPPPPPPPEQYKDLFVEKEGYANYYFNQVEQQRVLKGLDAWGDYSTKNGVWKLAGRDQRERPFAVTITPTTVSLAYIDQNYEVSVDATDFQPTPEGSGGLLTALLHFKLFLTQRGFLFSDFHYLGSEPLDGRGEKADVLLSELSAVQSRWYFGRTSPEFVGFDSQLSKDQDECEVRFLAVGEFDGRRFPSRWQIRSGNSEYAVWTIESVTLAEGPSPQRKTEPETAPVAAPDSKSSESEAK